MWFKALLDTSFLAISSVFEPSKMEAQTLDLLQKLLLSFLGAAVCLLVLTEND